VTEAEFFSRLEYRLCGEFRTEPPPEAPGLWCDGLIPKRWQFGADPSTISGDAWEAGLPGHDSAGYQEKWGFVLKLYERAALREPIRWESLLPGNDVRGWVVADVFRRRLVITLPANTSVPRVRALTATRWSPEADRRGLRGRGPHCTHTETLLNWRCGRTIGSPLNARVNYEAKRDDKLSLRTIARHTLPR
jgi:hypothetical protein